MNATTIYSKSGKGVQEASGKTSLLKRTDRTVLAAIDGRTTLGELARKLGKSYDTGFQQLIIQLDRNGFIREVSSQAPLSAASTTPRSIAPVASADPASDLDFSTLAVSPPKPAAPTQPPPEAKPAAPPQPSVDAVKQRAEAARRAKEQEAALVKARQEAEERAHQERDRIKAEAEARMRAEFETKLQVEAEGRAKAKANAEIEARLRAEAEAKVKTAREAAVRAAAEAKARAEVEMKARLDAELAKVEQERAKADAERRAREEAERRAKEEAERARQEAQRAREEAERARKQAEEKARREAEELRQKLEEERAKAETERRAREEAERKAKEEAQRLSREAEERARREAEALRKQLEEQRRQIEEERKRREEEDRARAQAEERARQAEERKLHEEREAKARQETEAKHAADQAAATVVPATAALGKAKFDDSLLADLDSFTQREDEERKAKEEDEERKAKEEADRRARTEAERKAKEQAERTAREQAEREKREEEEHRRREEEARREREEEERKRAKEEDRKRRAEAERARKEAEERKRKAKEAHAVKRPPSVRAEMDSDIGVSDEDLDMEDVKRDQRSLSPEARRAARERETMKAATTAAAAPARQWRPRKWGKSVAIGVFILLLVAVGLLHVMPISTAEYEKAAAEALGQPVRIGSGHLSLVTGVQLKFEDVRIGKHLRAATVLAFPQIGSLFEPKKRFDRIELEDVTLAQQALGSALFSKMKGDNFTVSRIVVRQLKLVGPLGLPAVDADIELGGDGAPVVATVRGPENLFAKLVPKASEIQFDINTDRFTLPFASEVTLNDFGMRGTASLQEMNVASWNGSVLDGTVSGAASLRWGPSWSLDGTIAVHGMNVAVFAPALVSEGKADGSGRFLMSSPEPGKLVQTGRIEGRFTIAKGVLGSIDLSRALQTGGRQVAGRTPFVDLAGQGIYDKGAVSLRSITFAAGMLNAGASADITQSGALSCRIVADVKTSAQTLHATLNLGGTIKDPQVRN